MLAILVYALIDVFGREGEAMKLSPMSRDDKEAHHIAHGDMLNDVNDASRTHGTTNDDLACMAGIALFGCKFDAHCDTLDAALLGSI